MKKAVSVLRWHSIYADIKPKLGDKCLISDDDGNIRLAAYCYLKKPNVREDGYYFFDILDGIVNNYVYCWAKIPEILSDTQLNNVDREDLCKKK